MRHVFNLALLKCMALAAVAAVIIYDSGQASRLLHNTPYRQPSMLDPDLAIEFPFSYLPMLEATPL